MQYDNPKEWNCGCGKPWMEHTCPTAETPVIPSLAAAGISEADYNAVNYRPADTTAVCVVKHCDNYPLCSCSEKPATPACNCEEWRKATDIGFHAVDCPARPVDTRKARCNVCASVPYLHCDCDVL